MISEQRHEYCGRWLEPGEAFDAEARDVHILKVLGRARVADEDLTYGTRAMTARRGKRQLQ
jgi:hypothetical protein